MGDVRNNHRYPLRAAQRHLGSLSLTDPTRPEALNDLGRIYQAAYVETNDAELLRKALSAHREASDVAADMGDLALSSRFLVNVGLVFQRLFQCEGNAEDIERSISTLEQAKLHVSDQFYGACLNNLGLSLYMLCSHQSKPDDLDRCIRTYTEGLALSPNNSTQNMRNNLCHALLMRFELGGSTADLSDACDLAEEAIASEPDGMARARLLDTCASCWAAKARHLGPTKDLELAIDRSRDAVRVGSEHPDVQALSYSINLGSNLLEYHVLTSSPELLNESIATLERIAGTVDGRSTVYANFLLTLAKAYLKRFEFQGGSDDISQAVKLSQEASSLSGMITPMEAAQASNCLGNSLLRRYETYGNDIDIDAAVAAHKAAIGKVGDRSPLGTDIWNNLCVTLLARFDLRNSSEDLDDAFELATGAINDRAALQSDKAVSFVTLGNVYLKRYERRGILSELDSAIRSYKHAVDLSPAHEMARPGRLGALSHALQARFFRSKSSDDILGAIEKSREAVATASRHHDLYNHYISLGNALLRRCIEKASCNHIQDLEESVKYLEIAHKSLPPASANLGLCLNNLGKAYELLFEERNHPQDYENAAATYTAAMNLTITAPSLRITAGYRGTLLCVSRDLSRAAEFVRQSVPLFPLLSSRAIQRRDQQDSVSEWAGFVGYGAAVLLQSGHSASEALQLLETGRNVINNNVLQTRTNLEPLYQKHPTLAKRFEALRDGLDITSRPSTKQPSPSFQTDFQAETRIQSNRDFERLLDEIRSKSGFAGFLRPPPESEFMAAMGSSGSYTIVINATSLRSDAIVISNRRIYNLHLSRLVHKQVVEEAAKYLDVLEQDSLLTRSKTNEILRSNLKWLWECALKPILVHLQLDRSALTLPRIWWMPIGMLSIFPFHAAGAYDERPRSSVLDRVISLYTPSIQSLIHSRKRAAAMEKPAGNALCISMSQTPNATPLPFAKLETKQTSSLLGTALKTRILNAPLKRQALEALKHADIVHLCCHGEVDSQDPSESCLLLQDWETDPLTVADIAALDLKSARLAYLSACHATSMRVMNLLDEGFHLAGAFQLAGFVQTVGTLWQVNDERAAMVSQKVYSKMLAQGKGLELEKLPEALHEAVCDLREATKHVDEDGFQMDVEDQPFVWAPFVCVGL